jgi:subtilisin family serine protease
MLRVSLVILAGLTAQGARVSKRSEQQTIAGVEVRNYRPGVDDWIVMFKRGTSDAQIASMCGDDCSYKGHPDEGGVPWSTVKGSPNLERMLTNRRSAASVEYLVPDVEEFMIPIIETTERKDNFPSWGLKKINVGSRSGIGAGVHIFVQDTGIRTTHVEFYGRGVPEFDATSGRGVCDSSDTSCAADRQGHGTHCAGTASGNSYGVAPGAKVHAVKTLSDSGSGQTSWQYQGIEHVTAAKESPKVLSMSLGGNGVDPGYETLFENAVKAKVVVVVAAGNSNADACNFSPAFAADAITVGATTVNNVRAGYSNFGTCVNIVAPGTDITSAWSTSDGSSRTISGTSMACPHVSGVAALEFEGNKGATTAAIRAKIIANAQKGKITLQKPDDPDLFLQVVGNGGAPAPTPAPPTPPPPPTPAPACRRRYYC